jgi:hypothetical protein
MLMAAVLLWQNLKGCSKHERANPRKPAIVPVLRLRPYRASRLVGGDFYTQI